MNIEKLFTETYEKGTWYPPTNSGIRESVSGAGSSRIATTAIRDALPGLIADLGVRSLFDVCCGDCNWITHIIPHIDLYVGADIVSSLIDENKRRFDGTGAEFVHLNLLTSDLPKADLVLCRDCLVHFSYEDVITAIENIRCSHSTYLLTTTFLNRTNKSITTGDWAPYNLQAPPFNFPEPLRIINENCKERYPLYIDKSLGLWRINELPAPKD